MTDWRWDSEDTQGMTVGAVVWIHTRKSPVQQRLYFQCHADGRAAPFVHHPALYARPADQKRLEYIEQPIFVPRFEVATTNSKLEPSVKRSYSLLPFRALEEFGLPGAIQQRWEVSVAASKSAEWRLWFQRLDQTQQKAHVQTLSKLTKEAFWAGLWLEYEEWSEPRRTRFVAAAARAVVIFEMENMMRRMEEARRYWQEKIARVGFQPRIQQRQIDLPEEYAEPLSAPLTPHNVISLGLRLAPCYFRVQPVLFASPHSFSAGNRTAKPWRSKRPTLPAGRGKVGLSGSRVSLITWCGVRLRCTRMLCRSLRPRRGSRRLGSIGIRRRRSIRGEKG